MLKRIIGLFRARPVPPPPKTAAQVRQDEAMDRWRDRSRRAMELPRNAPVLADPWNQDPGLLTKEMLDESMSRRLKDEYSSTSPDASSPSDPGPSDGSSSGGGASGDWS